MLSYMQKEVGSGGEGEKGALWRPSAVVLPIAESIGAVGRDKQRSNEIHDVCVAEAWLPSQGKITYKKEGERWNTIEVHTQTGIKEGRGRLW